MLSLNEQMDLVTRGVEEIVSEGELEERIARAIKTDTSLRVKYGIDPSGRDVHIGHMVPVSKMRDFQDAGHTGVLIIGDYTAQIGDPTGRDESRPPLTKEQVLKNAETYVDQLMKVLDRSKTDVRYQTEWFGAFTLVDVIQLGQKFTVAQMLSHETFKKRYDEGLALALHEIMYPMLMAYDSVAISADVELGGMEQRFNILQGRDLQRAMGQQPQIAVLSPMLPGTDGKQKMGKSLDNYIGVSEKPRDMFGKAMSIRDELIVPYLTLAAGVPPDVIEDAKKRLEAGVNPMEIKRQLGKALVARYYDDETAEYEDSKFMAVHSEKDDLPDDILDALVPNGPVRLVTLITRNNLAPSNAEARRLMEQGGVTLDGEKITDFRAEIEITDGAILKVGKWKYARLKVGG